MPLRVIQGDITRQKTDAIVNAANSRLAPGGGVCGAIFAAAGYDDLDRACRAHGGCQTGGAVLTPGFSLPCKYVIHAVGPVWQGGGHNEARLLADCYAGSLALAKEHGCRSISFPVISAGIYGYPRQEALRIAIRTVLDFIRQHDMDVYLVIFDSAMTQTAQTILNEEEQRL